MSYLSCSLGMPQEKYTTRGLGWEGGKGRATEKKRTFFKLEKKNSLKTLWPLSSRGAVGEVLVAELLKKITFFVDFSLFFSFPSFLGAYSGGVLGYLKTLIGQNKLYGNGEKIWNCQNSDSSPTP